MKTPFQLYEYFKISIIEDSIESVSKNLCMMLKDFSLKQRKLTKVDFRRVCSTNKIPYNANKEKFLLFEPATNPGSTVFFPNFVDGWYTAVCGYVASKNKTAYQVGFTIDNKRKYPAYFFNFFYTENGELKQRTVHAIKEDKWVFYCGGKPLPIEDETNYTKKNIKDRINNAIIIDYLKKAGYDLTNENFYKSNKKPILFSN